MKLKNFIGIVLIILFIFIIIGNVSAIEDNTTSNTLELNNNNNAHDVLEKIDDNYNPIEQKSTTSYDNIISVTSDSPILSSSNNGVKINHVAKYTITYKISSYSYSTSFTSNDIESMKSGEELKKDEFTIKYSPSYKEFTVYYSSMLEGAFKENFVNRLNAGETINENGLPSSFAFDSGLLIRCDSNYYSITYKGYTGKYSSENFEDFINGKTNYIHADTGKYKTTKDAIYKTKYTKKWFYVGEVVLKKKIKYVNCLVIYKKKNVNYLAIGRVKLQYNKVIKVVNKYNKVTRNLEKKGWEFDAHILRKVYYKNGKTIIKYYYKYEKSYEVFNKYKYYKNPCTMTLEHKNGKNMVEVWYEDKADYYIDKSIGRATFTYSI